MRLSLLLAAAALALGGATSSGPAQADVLVNFWNITTPGATNANPAGKPATAADATFTYTGPLTWSDTASQNNDNTGDHASQLLNLADITGFSSPSNKYNQATTALQIAAFGNTSLSASGYQYSSFFEITGTYSAASSVNASITHDDGFSIYIDGVLLAADPGPTTAVKTSFVLDQGTHTFLIDYVTDNGTPSVFNFDAPSATLQAAVPEPSTWAMMILGFMGVGFMAYRRKSQGTAFRFA